MDTKLDLKTLLYVHSLLSRTWKLSIKSEYLPIYSLSMESFTSLVDMNLRNSSYVDFNSFVLISQKMALRLNLVSGSWLSVKFLAKCESMKCPSVFRWIRLIICSCKYFSCNHDKCFVSEILFHNLSCVLKSHEMHLELTNNAKIINMYAVTRIFSLWNSSVDCGKLLKNFQSSLEPSNATTVKLSLIETYNYLAWDDIDFNEALSLYFSIPKYICTGDIIVVELPISFDLAINKYSGAIPPRFIHFKVLTVNENSDCDKFHLKSNSNGYLVCKEKTDLYLINSNSLTDTASFKIPHLLPFLTPALCNVPPHLSYYFERICDIINSMEDIQNFSTNATSYSTDPMKNLPVEKMISTSTVPSSLLSCGLLLLIGEKGSGKTRLIHLLAQRFCFYLKWINCYNIKGDSSSATEAKIRQTFSKIFPNTIVILSNVSCLSKVSLMVYIKYDVM